MKRANGGVRRWLAMGAVALGLTACGGGGGGGESDEAVALADARGGTYLAAAADGREYGLTVDFHDKTFRLAGTSPADPGVTLLGTFTQQGDEFLFRPDNAAGSSGSSATRFRFAGDDAIVGELPLPQGAVPFVAPRRRVATLEEAAGIYNLFERSVDRASSAPVATGIRQVQVTADGRYLTCSDAAVFRIADCPADSVTTTPIRVFSGVDDFNVFVTPTQTFAFHIGRVGNARIFLRTDSGPVEPGSNRQFALGLPAADAFAPASFVGGTTDPAWGTVTLGETSFASSATLPSGATVTRSGASGPGPEVDVRSVQSSEAGSLLAGHEAEIGVVVAAPGNTLAPGFIAIGKVQ